MKGMSAIMKKYANILKDVALFKNMNENDILDFFKNIPYIKKIDPLNKYLRKKATIDMQSLFDFIVQMNVLGELRFFPYEEDAETLQEC